MIIPTWLRMTNGLVAIMGVMFGLSLMSKPQGLPFGCAIIGVFLAPAILAWSGRALAFMAILYFGSSLMALIPGWLTMPEGAQAPTLSTSLWSTAIAGALLLLSFSCLRWHKRTEGAGAEQASAPRGDS